MTNALVCIEDPTEYGVQHTAVVYGEQQSGLTIFLLVF